MKAIRAIVWTVRYVVLSCDEMFIITGQSWLFVHCYVGVNAR